MEEYSARDRCLDERVHAGAFLVKADTCTRKNYRAAVVGFIRDLHLVPATRDKSSPSPQGERSLALKALEAPQLGHPIHKVSGCPGDLEREVRRTGNQAREAPTHVVRQGVGECG